jgi:hypothetical protein
MNLPKCNQIRCTLRQNCQRFSLDGSFEPIMPFLPAGLFNSPSIDQNPEAEAAKSEFDGLTYTGPVNGCEDYWPVVAGVEWFEKRFTKTPVNA